MVEIRYKEWIIIRVFREKGHGRGLFCQGVTSNRLKITEEPNRKMFFRAGYEEESDDLKNMDEDRISKKGYRSLAGLCDTTRWRHVRREKLPRMELVSATMRGDEVFMIWNVPMILGRFSYRRCCNQPYFHSRALGETRNVGGEFDWMEQA